MHFQQFWHENLQKSCGHSLAANVAPDSGHLLLFLHPCHVIPGHDCSIDDGGRGQGEGGLGVASTKRFIGIACILIWVSLALLLIDSIVLCDLVVMDNMSECSHPWSSSVQIFLLVTLVTSARFVLHMAQRSCPWVLIILFLWPSCQHLGLGS